MKKEKINKKIGGTTRAKFARDQLKNIFTDITDPLHLAKDIDLAKKYDVARHTIYKIRHDLKIPPRSKRVLNVLKNMDTGRYTLNEIAARWNLKYQNIYKLVLDNNIPYKKD